MKIYGIFRGFAGLGRVVSGMGLVKKFRDEGHEVKIFTYGQGLTIASKYNFECFAVKGDKDIGFMGIVPISPTGLAVIGDILAWQPDCVIIDGEPLMVDCLRINSVQNKIVTLVNPLDLYSEKNNPVTINYFRYLFCQSDMVLCHGLHSVKDYLPVEKNNKVHCLNTILRDEILKIKRNNPKYINCILGGGTKNCSEDFVFSTIEIAKRVMLIAKNRKDITFNIYCNDLEIGRKLENINSYSNVEIIKQYTTPADIYANSKLVICRAGRNTISELIYLKIPAIVISILGNIVSIEQSNNIKCANTISNGNIVGHSLNDEPAKIVDLFNNIFEEEVYYDDWRPGNIEAYSLINQLLSKRVNDF